MKLASMPTIFQLEITSVCNLRCTMCPYGMMTRPRRHMSWEVLREIRQYLKSKQTVGIHVMGEPLLVPDIVERIEYLSWECGVYPEFATNATRLTAKLAWGLLYSGLRTIWFSIDSADKAMYERIRVGADFDRVIHNIRRFLELNDHLGNPVKAIVQKIGPMTSEEDATAFLEMWEPWDARVKFLDTWAGTFDFQTELSTGERQPCAEPWERVAILENGDVVPCCRDWEPKYIYGNIMEEDLGSIWQGSKAQALREDMQTGRYLIEPCASCKEWWITMDRDVTKAESE